MSESPRSRTATPTDNADRGEAAWSPSSPAHAGSLPLDRYWEQLSPALPEFTSEEQRHAVTLYRELAKGEPLGPLELASPLGLSAEAAREILERPPFQGLVYRDDQGRVSGFGGLATSPMKHRFEVDGRELWTWCAWDSLFIPRILGATARVTTKDPQNGEEIQLVVTPEGVSSLDPSTAVVSFPVADANQFDSSAANVMATFCHFVFFFASRESGQLWTTENEGTLLLSMDDAFELGRRLNERSFGVELARTPY